MKVLTDEQEIWEDIESYNGLYQVSNFGRVRSLDHYRNTHRNGTGKAFVKGRILKPCKNPDGYLIYSFHNKSRVSSKKISAQRLVAMAFLPNPDNLPCVNHKDENPLNNNVDNLEWCTYAYNNAYGTAHTRAQATRQARGIMKPVQKFTINGDLVEQYRSIGEAAKKNHCTKSYISGCCLGRYGKRGSYVYKFNNQSV